LGWADAENVRFETRFVSDDSASIQSYAAELVGQARNIVDPRSILFSVS
jgi:hypothetical protein